MPIWKFYVGLSVVAFTLWWLAMLMSGPVTAIKFNHWIYESVQASWWLKQDIDEDFDKDNPAGPISGPPRYRP